MAGANRCLTGEAFQRRIPGMSWDEAAATRGEIWVFGYGSLMWRPGFPFIEDAEALLEGYRRSFCIWSEHHRGTPERRGLVLGLDPIEGAACHGHAFRVSPEAWVETAAYLEERELRGYAYQPAHLPVRLADGRQVQAHTFVAASEHPHYAGTLPLEETAEIILCARGSAGLNRDYLINTVRELERRGYGDPDLRDLLDRVSVLTGLLEAGSGI